MVAMSCSFWNTDTIHKVDSSPWTSEEIFIEGLRTTDGPSIPSRLLNTYGGYQYSNGPARLRKFISLPSRMETGTQDSKADG